MQVQKKAQKVEWFFCNVGGMVFAQEGFWSSSNLICGIRQVSHLTFCVPNDLYVRMIRLALFLESLPPSWKEEEEKGGAVASVATVAWGG